LSALYSSAWAVAELACVFLRHVREQALTKEAVAQVRDLFRQDVTDRIWRLLPVSDQLLNRVEEELRTFPPVAPLRAGDAVHLLTAREAGFRQIWTNDKHMLRAAPWFGIEGRSV
jgi:predicted nucleic acid-binding protein